MAQEKGKSRPLQQHRQHKLVIFYIVDKYAGTASCAVEQDEFVLTVLLQDTPKE